MEETTEIKQTWPQKLLFYTTAFFVLLGIFSLFSFLFLVPFVIDPAFTTIFMEFDENPVLCVTVRVDRRLGASNCSWTSCREGCTKDIYDCTQIFVNYKKVAADFNFSLPADLRSPPRVREERSLSDQYDFERSEEDDDDQGHTSLMVNHLGHNLFGEEEEEEDEEERTGLMGNNSEWYYREARLLPNVKGCGYPPMLNCTIFLKNYKEIGKNFTCYFSRVDPSMVISHLDMWQVYMNLVYAMAIPIPSFIMSVIYLAVAYFKIYNDDEETAPLEKNAEAMDVEGESGPEETPEQPASGGLTPASEAFREDLASFGHHFKVAMVDDMSRDSFTEGAGISASAGGNLGITMTTSISTTGGPIADI